MIALPLWAVYAVAFGTPASALFGVLLTLWLTRRTAREVDVRARREDLMRHVRWAADLVVDDDQWRAKVGVDQLIILSRAEGVDPLGQKQIDAALASVVLQPRQQMRGLEDRGIPPEPIQLMAEVADELQVTDDVRWHLSRDAEGGDQ